MMALGLGVKAAPAQPIRTSPDAKVNSDETSSESKGIPLQRWELPIKPEQLIATFKVRPKAPLPSKKCIICDVNRDHEVNILDILAGMRIAINIDPKPVSLSCVDKNADGAMNILDAIGCLQNAVDLITKDFLVQNVNNHPIRLAQGNDGRIYVSDTKVGSVFIYDAGYRLIGELKDFDRPLGVTVDSAGWIYVGVDGLNSVEVYDATGRRIMVIGKGKIQHPNDLDLDEEGNIYVVDSRANVVKVYTPGAQWLRDIGGPGDGEGQLSFPTAITIVYRVDAGGSEVSELYVADQGHSKIQVFDLQGNFLRSLGEPVPDFSTDWQGRFVRIQGLAMDMQGRLHAIDSFMNNIQILNPDTGEYLDSYGSFGTETGYFNVPLDILITPGGQTVVADTENHRLDVIDTWQ